MSYTCASAHATSCSSSIRISSSPMRRGPCAICWPTARDRLRLRAGGDWQRVTLSGVDDGLALHTGEQALALDAALQRLEQIDARAAQVVELRYFAGLTQEQIGEQLGCTRRTADRDWRFARAFLKSELQTQD